MSTRRKITRAQTKTHHKRLILKTIYDRGQISRASIARATRLTRPTVSSIVAELIAEGLVAEVGQATTATGKPPTLLSLVDDSRHLLGVDLANEVFRGAIVNLRGESRHHLSLPCNGRNGEAALALACELLDQLVASAERPLLGIGIGTPGLMDAEHGVVVHAVNLNWRNLPLRSILEARYHLPVYVTNSSHAAALGEYVFGSSRDVSNLIVVKVGWGVGAGIVLNGQLHYGDDFGAGEIGHVVVVDNGELCRCGHRGCLETVISSRAIVKHARAIAKEKPDSLLHQVADTPEDIDLDAVLQALQAGDQDVRALVDSVGRYLGIAIANMLGALNIRRVVIAGSVARFGDALLVPVRREIRQRFMGLLANKVQVDVSSEGVDIVVLGAAALLLANELGLV